MLQLQAIGSDASGFKHALYSDKIYAAASDWQ